MILADKKKKQKGAAIMMALFFFTIAAYIVTELSKETLTEAIVAGRDLKKLRSYYSAKAGLEIALLRIKAYQTAKSSLSSLGKDLPQGVDQQLNMVWQFPLPWPIVLPDGAGTILEDENNKVLNESLISKMTFFHEIKDSAEKVNLNNLGSPVERLSNRTLDSLLVYFQRELESNEKLSKEHSLDSIKEVLNNVADWVDPDDESRNGSSEKSLYPYEDQRGYPRNASLMSMSELMLVAKMDDLIFDVLSKTSTVHGSLGINVNSASKDVLMTLDPQFTEAATKEFIAKRAEIQNAGGQLDESSFDNLLNDIGFRNIDEIHNQGLLITYSPMASFHIVSSGTVGKVETVIEAYVSDGPTLIDALVEELDKKEEDGSNPPPVGKPKSTASTTKKKKSPPLKGRPLITHMSVD